MTQTDHQRSLRALALFLLTVLSLSATAKRGPQILYIATNGSDTDGIGSAARPWRSLAFAAANARAGSVIHIRAGIYDEKETTRLAPGVGLEGEGTERTTIRANLASSFLIELVSTTNVNGDQRIGGFTIDGKEKTLLGGILVANVNHVTLHHIRFVRCKQSGSTVVDSLSRGWGVPPQTYVTGIKIQNCQYLNCANVPFKKADGSPSGMSGNLEIGGLDGAEISQITIDDIARPGTEDGYGIKFASCGFFKNLKIHDCQIRVNEEAKAWVSNFGIELWNVGPGCEIYRVKTNTVFSVVNMEAFDRTVDHLKNLKIHDCTIVNSRVGGSNNEAIEASLSGLEIYNNYIENAGIGVAFWGAGNHLSLHNNVFCNKKAMNKVWGQFPSTGLFFDVRNGHYTDVKIYNNIFDNYVDGVLFKASDENFPPKVGLDGADIKNNAFLDLKNAVGKTIGVNGSASLKRVTLSYNLKDNDVAWLKATMGVAQSHNVEGNPGFRCKGDRGKSYYRPSSPRSFCVDKGTDVGLPYRSVAPDIGSIEYAPSVP